MNYASVLVRNGFSAISLLLTYFTPTITLILAVMNTSFSPRSTSNAGGYYSSNFSVNSNDSSTGNTQQASCRRPFTGSNNSNIGGNNSNSHNSSSSNSNSANTTIRNPFAALLYFYYQRLRNKLTPDGLSKIAKKYASKPHALLPDLESKYGVVPDTVNIVDVARICACFPIPEVFLRLIPELSSLPNSSNNYNKAFDASSGEFDVEHLFASRGTDVLSVDNMLTPITDYLCRVTVAAKLSLRDRDIAPMDNMSKVKHLVPGFQGFAPHLSKIENTVISATKHLKSQRGYEHRLPIVERIAIDSTYNRNVDGDKQPSSASSSQSQAPAGSAPWSVQGAQSLTGQPQALLSQANTAGATHHGEPDKCSPLFVLYQCLLQKQRVRVAIRDGKKYECGCVLTTVS
jgi:hypothetical protein